MFKWDFLKSFSLQNTLACLLIQWMNMSPLDYSYWIDHVVINIVLLENTLSLGLWTSSSPFLYSMKLCESSSLSLYFLSLPLTPNLVGISLSYLILIPSSICNGWSCSFLCFFFLLYWPVLYSLPCWLHPFSDIKIQMWPRASTLGYHIHVISSMSVPLKHAIFVLVESKPIDLV